MRVYRHLIQRSLSSSIYSSKTAVVSKIPQYSNPLATATTTSTLSRCQRSSVSLLFSTQAAVQEEPVVNVDAPRGSLFDVLYSGVSLTIGPSLIGQVGQVERTFTPQSNSQAMLTCGGPALAAHASFDPNYDRAVNWIQNHAVGPAVLSPILVSGLVGALTEAAFPQAIVIKHSLTMTDKPLIVGVTVLAQIKVTNVELKNRQAFFMEQQNGDDDATAAAENQSSNNNSWNRQIGYLVELETSVVRVQDEAIIAQGEQFIWIPDYKNM
mmetsp:Transcript_12538/g.16483  ORF Transcript_12538/g.16483 Transcript_12538/m.16483 type:complete len:268 (+) Transcript_12538:82-885(+)